MLPYEKRQFEVLEKAPADTDGKSGKKPDERTVEELLESSIVNINKPKGPTSHQVSEYVAEILDVKRAGQSGTLDPAVTGVLPIGIQRATRVLRTLLKSGKEYVCVMHLHEELPEEKIKEGMNKFLGVIEQLPPLKSAVKRQVRERTIYYIEIIEINGKDVLFKVGCEAGTYIRKLCDDMGKELGCGAHMAQLIRTKTGHFDLDSAITLQDLADAKADGKLKDILQPIESAVTHIPKVYVQDNAVDSLCNGAFLSMPGIQRLDSDCEGLVAVMTQKEELVGLGNLIIPVNKVIEKEKGVAIKMEAIFMKIGTYPKWTK